MQALKGGGLSPGSDSDGGEAPSFGKSEYLVSYADKECWWRRSCAVFAELTKRLVLGKLVQGRGELLAAGLMPGSLDVRGGTGGAGAGEQAGAGGSSLRAGCTWPLPNPVVGGMQASQLPDWPCGGPKGRDVGVSQSHSYRPHRCVTVPRL